MFYEPSLEKKDTIKELNYLISVVTNIYEKVSVSIRHTLAFEEVRAVLNKLRGNICSLDTFDNQSERQTNATLSFFTQYQEWESKFLNKDFLTEYEQINYFQIKVWLNYLDSTSITDKIPDDIYQILPLDIAEKIDKIDLLTASVESAPCVQASILFGAMGFASATRMKEFSFAGIATPITFDCYISARKDEIRYTIEKNALNQKFPHLKNKSKLI